MQVKSLKQEKNPLLQRAEVHIKITDNNSSVK